MRYLLRIMFLIIQMSIWAQDPDISSIDQSGDSKNFPPVKFRGELGLILMPKFSYLKGVSSDHYSPVTDKVLDYTGNDDNHHDPDDPGRKIGNDSIIEFAGMIEFNYSFIIPFYISKYPMLEDANISFDILFDMTPISFNFGNEIKFSPIPFLSISTGITFGTGWNIFGIAGLARNNYGGEISGKSKNILLEDSFYGPVMQNWISMELQFDLAEVLEKNKYKRWLHIVGEAEAQLLNTLLLNYQYYDRPYEWRSETTLNGWTFSSSFLLGYSIPVIKDPKTEEMDNRMFIGGIKHKNFTITPGISVELNMNVTHYNDSKMADKGWGSDFVNVSFGPMIMFDLPCNLQTIIGLYWANGMSYTKGTVGNADFSIREYKDWYIALDSLFISIGWEF